MTEDTEAIPGLNEQVRASSQALVEALAEDDAAKRLGQLHAVQGLVEALPKCQAGKALELVDML